MSVSQCICNVTTFDEETLSSLSEHDSKRFISSGLYVTASAKSKKFLICT